QEEISAEHNFHEIVGESAAMQALRTAIETVAPSNANVLITGETGTGKELVARAIHAAGPRRDKPLIKVNCASIPRELFESEFFGHVQGAFTGAIKDRAGRFQLADKGTLFLDEVGEIPLEMQSKLLRVLQEGEYERVGDEKTRHTDVRVIAATNRDLREEAEAGKFRQDLYYRLNVFPIEVAPLRLRGADVKLLAQGFWQKAAGNLNRALPPIPAAEIRSLQGYDWPGNVRELQNLIDRAAITSRGKQPRFDLPGGRSRVAKGSAGRQSTAEEHQVLLDAEIRSLEQENIRAALDQAGGRVYGSGGAAELLGLKATTLASRIKKLGLGRS
ncbi:MAG: sigma-54 interaction domain-containing protein, partial [Planctomycetota bacterium]